MAATPTRLMTVEEFSALPKDSGGVYHELRHGEVVAVTRPKFNHSLIQKRLCGLLEDIAEPDSYVDRELAYRPLPEYELWVADVAYLSPARYQEVDRQDYVRGAPDLVIEVLSRSNTAAEIRDKSQVCLANGCREFWVVDPANREVHVMASTGATRTDHAGDKIPLPLFRDATLSVNEILG